MGDYQQARQAMVDCQVRPSDVTRYAIIQAMLDVPREQFVPRPLRDVAYAESEIALGGGRSMLSPRVFAKMLEAAQIGADDLVLDLAPGLGYSTAVLAQLAAAVVAVEPDEAMAKQASETLQRLEYDNVVVSAGDPAAGGFPPAGDPVFESPLDQAFQPAPTPEPAPFDPVADAVGGAADAAAPQGPAPAPDPVTAPVAPEPEPAPEVADVPPPPEDPVVG